MPSAARAFLDTNVVVYAVDEDEPAKRATARSLLAEASRRDFVISTQVLQEFYVTVTRKLTRPVPESIAADAVDHLAGFPTVVVDVPLLRSAIAASRGHQLSMWDALILRAAVSSGCEELLSEDLQDGQTLDGVVVRNPFADR